MGRSIRFIPEGGALVEVTCRTVQSRFLLRPSLALNEIIVGVLARAKELYPIRICAFAFLSNHFHLLLRVESALDLSRFMNHVNSNLAREAGRLADWREKFWGRRYEAIVISQEEAAQIERLKYVLSHGCKEGFVERPEDWPGVHAARALAEGLSLEWSGSLHHAARAHLERAERCGPCDRTPPPGPRLLFIRPALFRSGSAPREIPPRTLDHVDEFRFLLFVQEPVRQYPLHALIPQIHALFGGLLHELWIVRVPNQRMCDKVVGSVHG
jgi:REP element-mobilizing transposase RayT